LCIKANCCGELDIMSSYKDTLNLPRTDFPMRANTKENDPKMVARWKDGNLFARSYTHNLGKPQFILHDGPPYANGDIHLGHAYNIVLKDIVTKYHRMSGKHVPVKPGWDCHGLPIELKVVQEQPGLEGKELRNACRTYANRWVDVQRESFKSVGALMDWDNPYITMNPTYEASIVQSFGKLVHQGFIERKNKTVAWCPSCQTTLASAEIEYADRKDPSVYARFELDQATKQRLFADHQDLPISFLVWTTTPWTLPLNRAVILHPNAEYGLYEINGSYLIFAKALCESIEQASDKKSTLLATVTSKQLEAAKAHHPLIDDLQVPVILDNSVELSSGTACVHSAPGCGPIDYELGVKHGLEIYSPISNDGSYTDEIVPSSLAGMPVADGQWAVLKQLAERGTLFLKKSLRHSYPHCWRCHNGLIFRATPQWFFDLRAHDVQKRALEAVQNDIKFYPKATRNFLHATVGSRWEWCLSRQRQWGVPIPALICKDCDAAYLNEQLIEKVVAGMQQSGIEFWADADIKELVPTDFACKECSSKSFYKETDILDVWFESGVSHEAVLKQNPELAHPADMYLEGVDQHRGWFQSSLLSGIAIDGKAPMRSVLSHGYTVDGQGKKMSKSIGNVVTPQELADKIGMDGLRLWAASIDYAGDAVMSDVLIKNVGEVFRKVRNTVRFMLSNLYDFDIAKDAVPFKDMLEVDLYALDKLKEFDERVHQAYQKIEYTAVAHELADFCTKQLSSLYLDVIKDRLYVEQADGLKRRSAQTAMWHIVNVLMRLVAPIMSFTAESISDSFQEDKPDSIHLQSFVSAPLGWHEAVADKDDVDVAVQRHRQVWEYIVGTLRPALLKAIEGVREQGLVKHPLEAAITCHIDPNMPEHKQLLELLAEVAKETGQSLEAMFKELCVVSSFEFVLSSQGLSTSQADGVWINVEPAAGAKCPRCWHLHQGDDQLCKRCALIV
jgi:isoleucyl-tRNA synthetase